MRFICIETPSGAMIASVVDALVYPLCGVEEFYKDPYKERVEASAPVPLDAVVQVPPVPKTAQILCVGLNYLAHIEETGRERPVAPNIFARWYSTLVCDQAEVRVPVGEQGLDWEGELGVIVGKEMTDVSESEAMDGVLGYTCFNDITGRTYQRRTPQWGLGKNVSGSGPIGPVVVTADEYGSPSGRALSTRFNGETVQTTSTDLMIFSIAEIISYASRCITLRPGDLIVTGTPAGVGSRRDPPVLMTSGDQIEVEIDGIGILRSLIV